MTGERTIYESGATAPPAPLPLEHTRTSSPSRSRAAVIALVALIMLASAFVRFYHLSTPKGYVFDEVYYAKDAETIIKGDLGPRPGYHWMPGDEVSWPHAEYGKFAIALGILAFGNNEFGWRFMPALAGLALLLCVYPIARRLGLGREWSLAALLLAAADFLGIVQSRTATLDIFVALWTVVTIYLTLRYVQDARRWYWLALAGVSAGLAIGSKWSGLWGILAAIVLIIVIRPAKPRVAAGTSTVSRLLHAAKEPALVLVFLIVVPVLLYVASYGLYFTHGHSLSDWWELQHQMWTFSAHLQATHPYASRADTWILDYRPVWYYYKAVGDSSNGVIAMGNPILWWASVLALVALPVVAIVDRNRALVLPSILVAVLYFFWFVFSRTSFLFYMMPVAPFMAILVAAGIARLARRPPRLPGVAAADAQAVPPPEQTRRERAQARAARGRILQPALVFIASAVFVALFWYPIGVGFEFILYTLPARVAPALGIAVCSLVGVAAIILLGVVASNSRYAGFWRFAGWLFVGACAGLVVAYLPILIDLTTTREAWSHLMWLPSWI